MAAAEGSAGRVVLENLVQDRRNGSAEHFSKRLLYGG
jgi:hypothetical protein